MYAAAVVAERGGLPTAVVASDVVVVGKHRGSVVVAAAVEHGMDTGETEASFSCRPWVIPHGWVVGRRPALRGVVRILLLLLLVEEIDRADSLSWVMMMLVMRG